MNNKKTIFVVSALCVFVAVVIGLIQFFFIGNAFVGSGSGAVSYNPIAREFGGTITVDLEPNRKLVNISWKSDNSLWILTRKMRANEEPEEYEYKENSSFGVIEGTVKVFEHK